MIQLHQSDWIMISMWVASAWSFLSLPAIIFYSPPPSLSPRLSTFSTPRRQDRFCIHISSEQSYSLRIIGCTLAINNTVFSKFKT